MIEVENRIFLEMKLFMTEHLYLYGAKRDANCYVSYYKPKSDKESCHITGNYSKCLAFARARRNDGRYKNFEFFIRIEKKEK